MKVKIIEVQGPNVFQSLHTIIPNPRVDGVLSLPVENSFMKELCNNVFSMGIGKFCFKVENLF